MSWAHQSGRSVAGTEKSGALHILIKEEKSVEMLRDVYRVSRDPFEGSDLLLRKA